MRSSDQFNIQHSTLNIAVGFNSQSQALAENNSTFNIQNSKFNIALCALELRHGTASGARHNQFNHS